MSALNICHKPDRLILMQDAAKYAPDGTVIDFVEKGVVIEEKNLFVAACGPDTGPAAFASLIDERFEDIDQIGDRGEGDIRALFDAARKAGHVRNGIAVAIGGWSQFHNRPRCVLFSAGLPGENGFVGDIGSNIHPALKGAFLQRWRAVHGMNDINIVRFDPMRDGLALMELQREQPVDRGERRGQFIVGGYVKLTEIYRNRIEQRIIRRWAEDEPEQKIQPKAVFATAPLSRQQRRAIERQTGRIAA